MSMAMANEGNGSTRMPAADLVKFFRIVPCPGMRFTFPLIVTVLAVKSTSCQRIPRTSEIRAPVAANMVTTSVKSAAAQYSLNVFVSHSSDDLNATAQGILRSVIDHAKASLAKIVTVSEGLDLVGTVVSGAGKLKTPNAEAVYIGRNKHTAATGPNFFADGKITYSTINNTATDWPTTGAGNVITNKLETQYNTWMSAVDSGRISIGGLRQAGHVTHSMGRMVVPGREHYT